MEIAIDLGKRRSYIVMEDNGKAVKEGYVETTKESFVDFFGEVDNPKVIVEASSTTNWVANMFEGYDITVAHPAKVRLIAQSVKKTDKTDAHTLMDLYKKDYLPKSYLPSRDVRDARDLCRDRSLIVRQRVALINKIKYHAFCLGIDIKGQGIRKKILQKLKERPQLEFLIRQLEETYVTIGKYDDRITDFIENGQSSVSRYARLIKTIPGFRSLKYVSLKIPFFSNRYLVYASFISVMASLVIVYTPLNKIFGTVPVHPIYMVELIGLALLILVAFDFIKVLNSRFNFLPL